MVDIIFNRYDLEKGNIDKFVLNQIMFLAKTVESDNSFGLLRLKIGVEQIKDKKWEYR